MIVELLLSLSMLAAPLLEPAQSADAATSRELSDFPARLAAAYRSGDCDGWGAMLAPDWAVIHISGQTITRAEAIRSCKMPEVKIDTMVSDDIAVRAYGDAAVVTGRTTVSAGGQTVVLRFTDFLVRRDGRWLAVASQATRLGR